MNLNCDVIADVGLAGKLIGRPMGDRLGRFVILVRIATKLCGNAVVARLGRP
jgi:hypothetical protein